MGSDANQRLHAHIAPQMSDNVSPQLAPAPHFVARPEFCLPSVKELAKHFAPEDFHGSTDKANSKHTPPHNPQHPDLEPELDYSTIPVSEIILTLQQAAEPSVRPPRRHLLCDPPRSPTQMEVRRPDTNYTNSGHEHSGKPTDGVRFNGKQVHSLTARSISKEFREGLRNGSYQKALPRADRTSSGESEQGDGKGKLSPTPTVDLKNMKKFWEEIITANANASKQK